MKNKKLQLIVSEYSDGKKLYSCGIFRPILVEQLSKATNYRFLFGIKNLVFKYVKNNYNGDKVYFSNVISMQAFINTAWEDML